VDNEDLAHDVDYINAKTKERRRSTGDEPLPRYPRVNEERATRRTGHLSLPTAMDGKTSRPVGHTACRGAHQNIFSQTDWATSAGGV